VPTASRCSRFGASKGAWAELRPLLELSTRLNGDDTSWTPGLAAVYVEAGMVDEARVLLDRLAAGHLATVPNDSLAPAVMSYLADAAFECGHQEIARQVLSRLEPYRGLAVYVPGLVCYGAADRYVGRLYSTLGQHDEAVAAFDAALELDQRTGWSTWIAHSQFALAQQLATIARRAELERARTLLLDAGATAASLGMSELSRRVAARLETLPTTPPGQRRPDAARVRGAAPPLPRQVEPPDRRGTARQPAHDRQPRSSHPGEDERRQPHRGGDVGPPPWRDVIGLPLQPVVAAD
jgi:tetratricopeptide (TPR) repeat protein